jgi:hypothetical protein
VLLVLQPHSTLLICDRDARCAVRGARWRQGRWPRAAGLRAASGGPAPVFWVHWVFPVRPVASRGQNQHQSWHWQLPGPAPQTTAIAMPAGDYSERERKAKGGVEGWRQRPKNKKGGVAQRGREPDSERRAAVPQAAREGRAKRDERREGRHPTGDDSRQPKRRGKDRGGMYWCIGGATHRRKLPMSSRCWAVDTKPEITKGRAQGPAHHRRRR